MNASELHQHLTRRTFLARSTTGLGAAALGSLMHEDLFAAAKPNPLAVPGAMKVLHFAPKAKRVIYLFQSGAPSHIDLYDPKPNLKELTGTELPKTVRGEQRITGFQMNGELLGMDAISTDRHQCEAVALEDSEVCEIPFSGLEELFGHIPALLHHFHRMMSQEITREQSVMLLLGNMRADQRFSAFLVNLGSRYAERGYSSTHFQLRMSREDIGNYLGLTIESISRLINKFKKQGLLKVQNREIELLDPVLLKAMAAGTEVCH